MGESSQGAGSSGVSLRGADKPNPWAWRMRNPGVGWRGWPGLTLPSPVASEETSEEGPQELAQGLLEFLAQFRSWGVGVSGAWGALGRLAFRWGSLIGDEGHLCTCWCAVLLAGHCR
jgi:hypothetical protein